MAEISRYRMTESGGSPWQPGSRRRVLRNHLGITRKQDADQAEYEALVATQTKYLGLISSETRFTGTLLRQMHRDWLADIYPWAGQYRTVELAKKGFRWPPARMVGRNMAAFSRGTLRRHTPCSVATNVDTSNVSGLIPGLIPGVARRLAVVHAELLLIHPFRDGNGRLARWLADLMALQAGLPAPVYGFTGRGALARRQGYLEAVLMGYVADYDPLTRFFTDALARASVSLG